MNAHAGRPDTTDTGHRGEVRSRINVSNTDDPAKVPWRHWLEAKVKDIGIYQGADGRVKGAWKPRASSCVMEHGDFFCRVCREAMVLRIYEFVDPVDEWTPVPNGPLEPSWTSEPAVPVKASEPLEFSVRVMRPAEHQVDVFWWILHAQSAPGPKTAEITPRTGTRRDRGPLAVIELDPVRKSRPNNSGLHRFTLKPEDLEPGQYRVICRAVDTTKMQGDKWPWVLKDEYGLLRSERGWWVVVE